MLPFPEKLIPVRDMVGANAIEITKQYEKKTVGDKYCFGEGNSNKLFLELLDADYIWQISNQKQFQELSSDEKN